MSSSSRTGTPQPWLNGSTTTGTNSSQQGLQLPQQSNKGKGVTRSNSQEPNGEIAGVGGGGGSGKATNVNSLMDAVGASGVDLGAEEESLRASNERLHAQAMQNQASQQGGANSSTGGGGGIHAYQGIDRSRKQDFIDPSVLAECVKKVAAHFQLKTLEPDTIPLIALATRHRLQSLINSSIKVRDHRQNSSHFKPPPFVDPSTLSTSSSGSRNSRKRKRRTKRSRRDPLTGDLIMDDGTDGEDEEMLTGEEDSNSEGEGEGEEGEEEKKKKIKLPGWDALVYDDPERYLTVLERVDRSEEARNRRERGMRDQKEQRELEQAQEIYAAEMAQKALEEEENKNGGEGGGGGGDSNSGNQTGGGGSSKGKAPKNAADRFLASNQPDGVPSTPTKELGKDGKPKKKKKPKNPTGGPDTPGGATTPGTSTPGGGLTSTPSATSIAKNMPEDVRKRLTDSSAMKSLGGTKYSWMNAGGLGSPSPASSLGSGVGGVSSLLGKPKFAPASSIGIGGGLGTTSSSSGLNPANNSPITANSDLANALTTSRLNVPPLHDSQRTKIAQDQWQAGHHVVELNDLLFALDRERGAGVGKGAGRNAAVRGRAGISRGGYRGVTAPGQGR
ncbi:hypothetical protein JCM5350_007260 [Sporobolomyces pararoseus]